MKVVLETQARSTGTTVLLVDNRDGSFEDMGEGYDEAHAKELVRDGAWATVCDTHGNYVLHRTRAHAARFQAHPQEFCEACMEIAEVQS